MSEYKCVSRAPADCTWNCSDGPCDCSGVYVDACGRKEEVEQLRAEIERMRPVVEAAAAVKYECSDGFCAEGGGLCSLCRMKVTVDAYRESEQEAKDE